MKQYVSLLWPAETVDVTLVTGLSGDCGTLAPCSHPNLGSQNNPHESPSQSSEPAVSAPHFSDTEDLDLNGTNMGTFPG